MSVRPFRSHRFTPAILVFAVLGVAASAGEIAPAELRSGFLDMSPESRAMQSDGRENSAKDDQQSEGHGTHTDDSSLRGAFQVAGGAHPWCR